MVQKREIIYPWLLGCCEHCPNGFWETIFEDMAYSKSPYGTYISNDMLCCSYKNKEFSYKIEEKDTLQIYQEIYDLLKNRLGLLSQQDRAKAQVDFQKAEEHLKEGRKNWGDIRKKNIKDMLIERYVIKTKKKYSLSISQTKVLLSIISIAILFKVITANDILYDNGEILNIEGIKIEKKKVYLERDLYSITVNTSPEIVNDKKSLSKEWEKYMKEMRKIANNNSHLKP